MYLMSDLRHTSLMEYLQNEYPDKYRECREQERQRDEYADSVVRWL